MAIVETADQESSNTESNKLLPISGDFVEFWENNNEADEYFPRIGDSDITVLEFNNDGEIVDVVVTVDIVCNFFLHASRSIFVCFLKVASDYI